MDFQMQIELIHSCLRMLPLLETLLYSRTTVRSTISETIARSIYLALRTVPWRLRG